MIKNIIKTSIIVCLSIILCGCGILEVIEKELLANKTTFADESSNFTLVQNIISKELNINVGSGIYAYQGYLYLILQNRSNTGITPLYDSNGKPLKANDTQNINFSLNKISDIDDYLAVYEEESTGVLYLASLNTSKLGITALFNEDKTIMTVKDAPDSVVFKGVKQLFKKYNTTVTIMEDTNTGILYIVMDGMDMDFSPIFDDAYQPINKDDYLKNPKFELKLDQMIKTNDTAIFNETRGCRYLVTQNQKTVSKYIGYGYYRYCTTHKFFEKLAISIIYPEDYDG